MSALSPQLTLIPALISTLTLARWARCLVFVSSQKSAEHVALKLQRAGYAAMVRVKVGVRVSEPWP